MRSKVATPTSALPARPERPVKYACPTNTPDGTIGYDRPLENYLDVSQAGQLMPSNPTSELYNTMASAHDYRFQPDPTGSSSRPFLLNRRERRRSLAKLSGDSPDYMGISPDLPGWRPRRSSYEDRRGVVPVAPSEVNTLVPYIPPIDTSMPPPSKEWLDAKAREILAAAQAEFGTPGVGTPGTIGQAMSTNAGEDGRSSTADNQSDFDWEYESDDTVYPPRTAVVSRISAPLPPAQASESESQSHDGDFNSDTDTDTDSDSDDGYNWSSMRISDSSPRALAGVSKWVIPRKRPSVVISENGDVFMGGCDDNTGRSPSPSASEDRGLAPPSSGDERTCTKRKGRKSMHTTRSAKKPKRRVDDTPARQGLRSIGMYETRNRGEATCSAERATPVPPSRGISSHTTGSGARAASPSLPQPTTSQILPQVPRPQTMCPRPLSKPDLKTYPCLLDGCTHVCFSLGDLQRHQLSLRHCAPSYPCLACGKSYTRQDALKRHLIGKVVCKRLHEVKLAEGDKGGVEE